MAKMSFKNCKWCDDVFEYESWNNTRCFCSKSCSSKHTASSNKLSFNDFITKANIIHDNKFDYSKVELNNRTLKKVIIICPIHGKYEQIPSQHLSGKGCLLCGKDSCRKTNKQFITEAKSIHGNKYCYSESNYINCGTKIKIICNVHGSFWQIAQQHTSKHHKNGCPGCSMVYSISKGEVEWLDFLNIPERQKIITIDSNTYIVDGYDPDTNTIYEYLGDYWHGNPTVFEQHKYNYRVGDTFSKLYENTIARIHKLEKQGYNVIYI